MINPLRLTRFGDGDRSIGLVTAVFRGGLDLLNNIVSIQDLTEDTVFTIEPVGDSGGDEELRA
jgi:hypothetical protein